MKKIFISYRREDTQAVAGRLYDALEARLESGSVFFDIDNIPLGKDFRTHIRTVLDQCGVLLVLIGSKWLNASRNDERRLDNPDDLVRVEIETALQRGIPVIPVLVDQAAMPSADQLPGQLSALAFHNAARLDSGVDFRNHVSRLIAGVTPYLASATPDAVPSAPPQPASPQVPERPAATKQALSSHPETLPLAEHSTAVTRLDSRRRTWLLSGLAALGLLTLYGTFWFVLLDSADRLVADMQSLHMPLTRATPSKGGP